MKSFDLCNAPLERINLIEAGAGTGKTYAIAGLFLRLVVENGLGADQILVVTYTKAATEELKHRIRTRLVEAKGAFGAGRSQDPLLACLLARNDNHPRAVQRLQGALLNFDRAAIFTIHGFCHRLLQNFAFETGHLFRSELRADALPLVQEAADDFWRRYISRAPYEIARYILDKLKGPEKLTDLYQRARFPVMRIIPPVQKPDLSALRPWRREAAKVQALWPQVRAAVVPLLQFPGLNARYYGNCVELPDQPGVTQRSRRVCALAAAMDRWPGSYPLFKHFDRLGAAMIAKATRKGHPTPTHPFFDLCQNAWMLHQSMQTQLAQYLRYLKGKFLQQAGRVLDQKKNNWNVLFFDDLLLRVQQALSRQRGGRALQAIQHQYRAALVDEFQDTDPLQYDIFKLLFTSGRPVFFLIGDPKQAIYSFRGADLYAYLAACAQVDRKRTLTRNWRAQPKLVQAVNAIFGNHPQPFGLEQVDYPQATAARTERADADAALTLWYLVPTTDKVVSRPLTRQEAVRRIATAVAEEIVRLLQAGDGQEPTRPEEIAVLTRSHFQAQVVKEALVRCRVPAVLYSAGSVFMTHEAGELSMILRAAADPSNPRLVRNALATEMLGAFAREFITDQNQAGAGWEMRWEHFYTYHQIWLHAGFYPMFSRLMQQEGVKQRLLPLIDGERRVTNILHLAELLHQAATAQHLGPEALISWLETQQAHDGGGEETQQLRLESDSHAVRILTIHKSKGLQFEVVFCPFTWSGPLSGIDAVSFHDPQQDNRLTLALGPDLDSRHHRQSQLESLAENLRLLYVALTRARRHCYWVWGRINKTALSAPAYLLHGSRAAAGAADWITCAQPTLGALTDADLIGDLQALAAKAPDAICLAALPTPSSARYPGGNLQPSPPGHCRAFERPLDRQWRVASFSSLTAGSHDSQGEWPDRELPQLQALPGESEAQRSLFEFPAGAQAGLFFHDVLEHWDFTCDDAKQRHQLVVEKLACHGYADQWTPAVEKLLVDLACLRLPTAADGEFSLNQVPPGERISEMEFHFPLQRLRPEKLKPLLATAGQGALADGLPYLHGYMKGFIDLVLRYNQRYYLVDWKSNFLGARFEDYGPQQLERAMGEANYVLQYYIYVTALNRFLRSKLRSYEYARHFGGVYYIFLRGIQTGQTPPSGIYYTLPGPELVAALDTAFVGVEEV